MILCLMRAAGGPLMRAIRCDCMCCLADRIGLRSPARRCVLFRVAFTPRAIWRHAWRLLSILPRAGAKRALSTTISLCSSILHSFTGRALRKVVRRELWTHGKNRHYIEAASTCRPSCLETCVCQKSVVPSAFASLLTPLSRRCRSTTFAWSAFALCGRRRLVVSAPAVFATTPT